MKTSYITPHGEMDCYENYLIFRLSSNGISGKSARVIMKYAYDHYNGNKFVFISNRKFASNIEPEAYKAVNPKYMVGIAIVSENLDVKVKALTEQELYRGSFSFFTSEDEAADWANTVVRNQ